MLANTGAPAIVASCDVPTVRSARCATPTNLGFRVWS